MVERLGAGHNSGDIGQHVRSLEEQGSFGRKADKYVDIFRHLETENVVEMTDRIKSAAEMLGWDNMEELLLSAALKRLFPNLDLFTQVAPMDRRRVLYGVESEVYPPTKNGTEIFDQNRHGFKSFVKEMKAYWESKGLL